METELEMRRARDEFNTFTFKSLADESQDGVEASVCGALGPWLKQKGFFAEWMKDKPNAKDTPRFSYYLLDAKNLT